VNRLGDDVFARSGFAGDQHAGVGGCDALESVHDAFHAFAGVDQVFKSELFVQPAL